MEGLVVKLGNNNFKINNIDTILIDETGDAIPMVSVTMITYNHQDYIVEAIEGVLMQKTNFKFVLVIGEDCGTDETRKIILEYQKKYPQKIILKLPESNLGIMENSISNKMFCNGKYIAECEGDDYWTDPLKLQKQVDFLETNKEYVLCFHKINILKPDGEIVPDFITKVPENYESIETLARLGNYIHTPSVVFRNIIKEFPPEYGLSTVGDYFLYVLLSEYGKLKYIEDEMAIYREGVGVWSAKSNFYRNLKTAQTHSLIVRVMLHNTEVCDILINRIKRFVNRFNVEIKPDDLVLLTTCAKVQFGIYEVLLGEKLLNKESNSISSFTVIQLFQVILKRLKKRIWK